MSVERMWAARRDGADLDALSALATTPEERFYLAMVAHCGGEQPAGAALARQAAELDPDRALYVETARYLQAGERRDVYAATAAFTAFASGGGNVGLYRAERQALRAEYAAHRPARLLDIGTGEGHGLLPALTPDVGHVDVVEPSAQRLAVVTAELARRGIAHRAYATTIQRFAASADAGSWDLVQATFALSTLSRTDRAALFGWLRPRAKRVALVEFDVPDLGAGLEPRCFRYLVERYERGLREYDADRGLVAQGFLVPILLGVLGDDSHQRHYEQPISWWTDDLAAAGFAPDELRWLYDYWWAPAYLVTAA